MLQWTTLASEIIARLSGQTSKARSLCAASVDCAAISGSKTGLLIQTAEVLSLVT
jgi:hypothetical protein